MSQLASFARFHLWVMGIAFFALALLAAFSMLPLGFAPGPVFLGALGLPAAVLGSIHCLAAYAWKRNRSYAKPLVTICSLIALALFPLGTAAGAVGLYWCFSRKARQAESIAAAAAPPEHRPKPGDGTQAWIQQAIPIVEMATWWGSLLIAGWWGETHGLPKNAAINGLAVIAIGLLISVFLHELGHALAAWSVEMKPVMFHVGPFHAHKQDGRWKLRLSLAGLFGFGGATASVPLHIGDLRRRMLIEVAGGPLASVLSGLTAISVLLAVPGTGWEAWWKVPAVVAAISLQGAAFNLIPFGFAAGFSDGALLVQLFRGGPFADYREAMKLVGTTTATPTRPRDLDPVVLHNGMQAGTGRPEEGMLQMIQLICAIDRQEAGVARGHLRQGLERIPAPDKAPDAGCAAEMALYIAYLDGNAGRAAEWLKAVEAMAARTGESFDNDFDYWFAAAAVRKAEGRAAESEEAFERAARLLAVKPQAGLYQYERDLIRRVRYENWVNPAPSAAA